MPRAKSIASTLLVAGLVLLVAAYTDAKPLTGASFSQSGSASYPTPVPEGTVSITKVRP